MFLIQHVPFTNLYPLWKGGKYPLHLINIRRINTGFFVTNYFTSEMTLQGRHSIISNKDVNKFCFILLCHNINNCWDIIFIKLIITMKIVLYLLWNIFWFLLFYFNKPLFYFFNNN